MKMRTVSEIDDVREVRWKQPTATWALVPTMGYLHEGHLSLVRRARAENDRVGVSVFVNPIQFNNPEDLEKYPRNTERDAAMLEKEGVDLLWVPTSDIIYPPEYQTYVDVTGVSLPLEGAVRPGHFRGVTTVVAKLFNVFAPTRAYFGQKDAQQVAVIRRMATDLAFNLSVVVCPTVREHDGLAMSSRNVRLSPEGRREAVCLYRALKAAEARFASGCRSAAVLLGDMRGQIEAVPGARIDYLSAADPETLMELETITGAVLLSLAVHIGGVRLIDNLLLTPPHCI